MSNQPRNILIITVDQMRYPRLKDAGGMAAELKDVLALQPLAEDNAYARYFPGFQRLRKIVLRYAIAAGASDAVPFAGIDAPRSLVERYCAWLFHARPAWHGAPGLYQFKAAFAPDWEPRYLLAPHLIASIAAGLSLERKIRPSLRNSITAVEKERWI